MNSFRFSQPATWTKKNFALVILTILLAPVLLTCLTVLIFSKKGDAATVIGLFGGGISGIICGTMLGRRIGKTRQLKIILGIVFMLIMIVVSVGMNCFGCLASGYQLNFH